jgi:predicted NUDIX family NTP pyrophosphohydrolase
MPKRSAGLLLYRRRNALEVFLVHPGGPFWAGKDRGAWSIPKGEYSQSEDPLAAAQREFTEETGFTARGPFVELGMVRQASGKIVAAWAAEGDCDPSALVSNACQIEWPPRSGKTLEIPEVDRGAWFALPEARERILAGQNAFLDALARQLALG